VLKNLLFARKISYQKTFNNPEGQKVLADLRRFCRATMPTADVNNERTTYLLEGRREVWLRIMSHLQLSDDDVYNLTENYNE
jgi:hypothetical protein